MAEIPWAIVATDSPSTLQHAVDGRDQNEWLRRIELPGVAGVVSDEVPLIGLDSS
jgi:hypothetical protein